MAAYRITSLLTFATLVLYATSAIIPERNSVDIGAIEGDAFARNIANIGAIDHGATTHNKLKLDANVTARGGGPTCRRSIGNKGARGGCYDGSSKRGDDGGCC